MPLQFGSQSSHFSVYYHSKGLLFQFILAEFIAVSHKFAHVRQLANQVTLPPSAFNELQLGLADLAGSSPDYMKIFMWNHYKDGLLAKLKNNCALFSQKSFHHNKNAIQMSRYTQSAWLLSLECQNIIRQTQQKTNIDFEAQYQALSNALGKIYTLIRQLGRSITRVLPEFRDDENVVFFILRHRSQLDELFEQGFVAKLLNQMYSNGLREVSHFLQTRYARRGFDNLLPAIALKIFDLETASL